MWKAERTRSREEQRTDFSELPTLVLHHLPLPQGEQLEEEGPQRREGATSRNRCRPSSWPQITRFGPPQDRSCLSSRPHRSSPPHSSSTSLTSNLPPPRSSIPLLLHRPHLASSIGRRTTTKLVIFPTVSLGALLSLHSSLLPSHRLRTLPDCHRLLLLSLLLHHRPSRATQSL
jgi:hypothetical protein